MTETPKYPRVSDETLASICSILDKTEGNLSGDSAFGDCLRASALDLRDLRAIHVAWQAEAEKLAAAFARWEVEGNKLAKACVTNGRFLTEWQHEAELLAKAMPPPELLRFAADMVQMPIPQLESVNPAAALRAAADAIEAAMKETA
jgi:hypothetical protein